MTTYLFLYLSQIIFQYISHNTKATRISYLIDDVTQVVWLFVHVYPYVTSCTRYNA